MIRDFIDQVNDSTEYSIRSKKIRELILADNLLGLESSLLADAVSGIRVVDFSATKLTSAKLRVPEKTKNG